VFVIIVAMLTILGITAWVFGLVAMGIRGRGRGRAPGIASRFAEAARHFNGEAEPPESVQRFVERRLVRTSSRSH
jgi:hypothetical protein